MLAHNLTTTFCEPTAHLGKSSFLESSSHSCLEEMLGEMWADLGLAPNTSECMTTHWLCDPEQATSPSSGLRVLIYEMGMMDTWILQR